MKIGIIKDNILIAVQERTPLAYETILAIYEKTGSYDVILTLSEIALEFNVDVLELADFLYRK